MENRGNNDNPLDWNRPFKFSGCSGTVRLLGFIKMFGEDRAVFVYFDEERNRDVIVIRHLNGSGLNRPDVDVINVENDIES